MFPDIKNSFLEKSFWRFDLHFVLKLFILEIFQITEKKQQTKNQQFYDGTFDVITDIQYLTL